MSVDVSKLTREEKLKQLALIEEKKKRLKKARTPYAPRPGQLKVLSCTKKQIFNFSGNGGGKTTILVHRAMAVMKGKDPYTGAVTRVPAKVIFVVDNARKITERIIPEFKKWFEIDDKWLDKMGKPYVSQIRLPNGSTLDFYSSDADPSSFEGVEASLVLVDEPVKRPLYVALIRSLRMKGHVNTFMFCGTAISEPWLRRDIYDPWSKGERDDIECFNLSTHDNAINLDDSYIANMERSLSEAEKKVRLHGGFFDSDSLALAHLWSREAHVIPAESFKYDPRMPCVVAIDPHSVKPHTALLLTVDSLNRYIAIKEMAVRSNAQGFARALKEFEHGYTVVDRVCDSLGNMEMTSGEGMHSFIEGLRANGVVVRATTFKEKSHEDLIDRLRQGLTVPIEEDQFGQKIPKLRVLSSMRGLISDIEGATWQKNRATGESIPKIDTSVRDHLSCLGYALATNLFYDTVMHTAPTYREADGAENVVGSSSERRDEILRQRRSRLFSRRFTKHLRGSRQ